MMKIKNLIVFAGIAMLATAVTSCEDMFSPAKENNRGVEEMYGEANYAMGLLGYAYAMLPYDTKSVSDVATDDAVSNNPDNDYKKMATGSWRADNNPMQQWQARKATIQYLNVFLEIVDNVTWSADSFINSMYIDHLKGEAYALRALNMYYLLMAHGGYTSDGELMGFPILTKSENTNSDFNVARNTYQECLDQIFSDLDNALDLLPLDYDNCTSNDQVPDKYKQSGVEDQFGAYNRVFGTYMKGRMSGRIAEAIYAQVALLASSPAFSGYTNVSSEMAAKKAAIVLNRIGGVDGMDPNGYKWFMNTSEIDGLGSGSMPKEVIWRSNRSNGDADWDIGLNQEADNFPPSLSGKGRINPTQNLVDVFPMANGYPIEAAGSGYASNDPYANRDPRLSEYVIFNGASYKNKTIVTSEGDETNVDRLGAPGGFSTKTGYYMRKLLREDCNPSSSAKNPKYHYSARIRYTEIFLDYAEAANEAWGPMAKVGQAYSAYDVIKAIRARAGVGAENGDAYLESIKGDQAAMRELIRNERRIELCFENKRFWDLRRWNAKISEPAYGVKIAESDGILSFTKFQVEDRKYQDYMYYGPIPYDEVKKWSNLKQNEGWN